MNLFDASALLCLLQGEAGSERVERVLLAPERVVCSAANWSEVAQKVRARGGNWDTARGLLLSYDLAVEPVLATDAERAAERWHAGSGLSLADRLGLATADRFEATAWTADQAWGIGGRVAQVR